MTINTGVSAQLRRPQTFHTFLYSYRNRVLVPLPLRIALVGSMSAAATAVEGTVYEVSDSQQTDALFGVSSELALMCRMAMNTGAFLQRGPRVYAVPITAPSGGAAGVQTFTVTGTATADGNIVLRVAGRSFTIGVRSGDAQATVATAIANALKTRAAELPVIVTVATNVVTLTAAQKGVVGLDVVLDIDQQVAGSSVAIATSAAGSGAYDITVALDALSPLPFDGVAIGNHAAGDITDVNSDLLARWGYSEKRWRYYFFGERGSIGTATSLATAANHQAVVIGSFEGCRNIGGEIATALCFAAFSRELPNANYDGLKIPLYPPAASVVYTPTEVETAIAAGLTPLTAEIDPFTRNVSAGVAKIERMITTKTTESSQPFEVLRDLGVSRTGIYIALQLDAAYVARFGASASPSGTLLTDDTIDQVRDMVVSILRSMEKAGILRDVDVDLPRLVIERDEVSIGRLNVDIPYTVVSGLHQIAYVHRVQV